MVTQELDKKTVTKLAIKTKEKVFELEAQNDRYIYVFRSKGDWWKIGGRSALFYAHIVSEKLAKKPPKIVKDNDHYYSFRTGICAKKDLNALAKELAKIGMEPKKIDPTIYCFEFEKPIDFDVITSLIQAKEVQNERANKLVDTQLLLPKLHTEIRELMKLVWYFTDKHNANMSKKLLLPTLLENACQLKRIYSRTSNGYLEPEDGLLKIMLVSNDMMADVAFLKEIDEMTLTNCNKIQNKLGEIIHIARVERNKIERKKRSEAEGNNPTS